uniref:Uncharacterized protein n=1 Tax=Acrobeloides nanus TaxID=290746 RepID=A0A914DL05_9BILA
MLLYIPVLLIMNYATEVDAYLFFKLPSKFFHRRELSSWKCAQSCFSRIEEIDYPTAELRHKRDVDYKNTESQIAHNLMSYCEKSDEELSCLKTCTESDVQRQLLDLGMKVKILTCFNVTDAVKTYNCVLENQVLPESVSYNCKPEINALDEEVEKRAQQGEQVIPGKQFCSLESCSRGWMKKILPMTCGEKSFSLYTSINDMANIVHSLNMFETKPLSEDGILCIDRPISDTVEEVEEEMEEDYEDEK